MAPNMQTDKLAKVASLDHVNILTNDIDACRRFYIDILGFEEGFRPDFGFPGLWIYLDSAPVLHFIKTDKSQPMNSGAIDHIAFRAHNFENFAARLKANNIDFSEQAVPEMDLHQIFCYDPHGIKVEFNFAGQDRPWKTLQEERKDRHAPPAKPVRRAIGKASTRKTATGKDTKKDPVTSRVKRCA